VTRAIATAQKRVETHNFEIRKHLLEYDDVMNKQREIVYGMRRQILEGESQAETVEEWIEETAAATVDPYATEEAHPEDWDLAGLVEGVYQQFGFRLPVPSIDDAPTRGALDAIVLEAVRARYAERERELGADLLRALERHEMLIVIDQQWKDHLLSIDHLKEGIGLRGYGQRDPLTEYKREAFDLFQAMVDRVKTAVVERLFKVQVVRDMPIEMPTMVARANVQESRGTLPADAIQNGPPAAQPARPAPVPRTPTGEKVGRNDPCPCGSGKKYKRCCYLKGA
jgi:preprotein translocase subunit SecA